MLLVAGTVADIDLRVNFPSDPRLIVTYGEVTDVDLEAKHVMMAGQEPLEYEWLVMALGCTDKYHGIEGAELYSTQHSNLLRQPKNYQALNDVKPYGQVSIVGGGLSGVEVAAELRERRPDLNIRIIDRGPSILSAFPSKLQSYVSSWFIEHEVEMRGSVSLTRLEEGVLYDHNNTKSNSYRCNGLDGRYSARSHSFSEWTCQRIIKAGLLLTNTISCQTIMTYSSSVIVLHFPSLQADRRRKRKANKSLK